MGGGGKAFGFCSQLLTVTASTHVLFQRYFPLLAVFSLWEFVLPDQVGLVLLIVFVFLLVTACGL